MTKARLAIYGKLKREIQILTIEMREMRQTDAGIGSSVIMNGKNGTKKPESVVGFDEERYARKKKVLAELQEQAKEIEEWVEHIKDTQARYVIRLRYIEGLTWEQVARRAGYPGKADYVRIMISNRFLENNSGNSESSC